MRGLDLQLAHDALSSCMRHVAGRTHRHLSCVLCARLQIKRIRRNPEGRREVTPVGGAPTSLGEGWYQNGMAGLLGSTQPFYAVRVQDAGSSAVSAQDQYLTCQPHPVSLCPPLSGPCSSSHGRCW